MKPKRQKQQEALGRRKENLVVYTTLKSTDKFPNEWPVPETEEEASRILNNKRAVCAEDIKQLETILSQSY